MNYEQLIRKLPIRNHTNKEAMISDVSNIRTRRADAKKRGNKNEIPREIYG